MCRATDEEPRLAVGKNPRRGGFAARPEREKLLAVLGPIGSQDEVSEVARLAVAVAAVANRWIDDLMVATLARLKSCPLCPQKRTLATAGMDR